MHLENWLIGPQLIGFIFILVGLLQKRFPPKHINNFYGYRMPSSMKNQQTWDEANSFSARYCIKLGLIILITGLVITAAMAPITMTRDTRIGISAILLVAASITTCLLLIVGTEKHLSNTFDKPL